MKRISQIFLSTLILTTVSFAQTDSLDYKKIETGNWLDLSFQPLNEEGEEIAFFCVETLPEFPGGYDSLASFIKDTLKYPETAIYDSIQGRVLTSFIVDWSGNVKSVKTITGVRHDLDSACFYSISILPDWIPAKSSDGQKIDVLFILPIIFILED